MIYVHIERITLTECTAMMTIDYNNPVGFAMSDLWINLHENFQGYGISAAAIPFILINKLPHFQHLKQISILDQNFLI